MFNPNYSLFNLTSNGVSYFPNAHSYVNQDHLAYFKFIGRIIGKALFDGELLECHFSKPLYKMMLGEDLSVDDLEDLDNNYFNNVIWSLKNDVTDLEYYHYVDQDFFGKL